MDKFSHIDEDNLPTMVDVSHKDPTDRQAHARTTIEFPSVVADQFIDGEIRTAKGPVFSTAIIAGVMASKKTHELIPFCHSLGLDNCKITINMDGMHRAVIDCHCKTHNKTGVEMEALTGATVAALTIYDMCKAVDRGMRVSDIRLTAKSGGQSGEYEAE